MKYKIVKIKWDNQDIKPNWINEILNKTYNDYDYLISDLELISSWYNKPLNHFEIKVY